MVLAAYMQAEEILYKSTRGRKKDRGEEGRMLSSSTGRFIAG
jgi:hypothetical protein